MSPLIRSVGLRGGGAFTPASDYSDDFEAHAVATGIPSGWSQVDGFGTITPTWSVTDTSPLAGTKSLKATATGSGQRGLAITGSSFLDGEINVLIRPVSVAANNSPGVLARWTDNDNALAARINPISLRLELYQVDGGVTTSTFVPYAFTTATTYRLRLVVSSGMMSAYVYNTSGVELTHGSLEVSVASGAVGVWFGGENATMMFDDFTATADVPTPPVWTPASLPDLLVWLRASDLALSDGDPIGSWTDLSGNGNHATQATAGKKPTFKTNIVGGKAVARFDGGDALVLPSLYGGRTSASVATVIGNFDGTAGLAILLELSTDFNVANSWLLYAEPEVMFAHHGSSNVYNERRTTGALGVGFKRVLSVADRLLTNPEVNVWLDADASGTQTYTGDTTGTYTSAPVYVGARAAASYWTKADFAEIILTGSAIGPADRAALDAYFRAEYGL